ncbi:MAG: type II secretion system F family protein [Azoarcus sp.]|jgi:type IV pilus assembly protein PilC|nr:type II secretion system F family protein [Azoarcus sp.]
MTGFTYLCLTAQGAEARGQMDAPDEAAARRQLRERGLKILSIAEGVASGRGVIAILNGYVYGISRLRSISDVDRVLFFRQMQLMLKAGHTVLEALAATARLTAKARLADSLGRVAVGIQRGSSFSVACSGEKELFDRLALKLIEAGEASGELGLVFERLAALIERRGEVRRQLATALVYPGFVLLSAIGVVSFLVITVIPRFALFLNGRGKALPWEAQTMLDVSDWLGKWGGTIGVIAVAFAVGIPLLRRAPPARRVIDRAVLVFPVLGVTLVVAAMAQVMWIFGVLVKSRLTVLESLRICAQVSGNATFTDALSQAADDVLAGKSLTVAFEGPSLPQLVQHMAAVGEKSGQLDMVMESLGEHYQKLLDARVKLLAAMIEPVLIVTVGGVVGFVYFAFFKAMMTISTGA